MRVEVISRIWLCDKKHSRCRVKYAVHVRKQKEKKVQSYVKETMIQEYVDFLRTMVQFMHHHVYTEMKPIILIDENIHEDHDAYAVALAYFVYYGNMSWTSSYKYILQKTMPFTLSKMQEDAMKMFEKMYRGNNI